MEKEIKEALEGLKAIEEGVKAAKNDIDTLKQGATQTAELKKSVESIEEKSKEVLTSFEKMRDDFTNLVEDVKKKQAERVADNATLESIKEATGEIEKAVTKGVNEAKFNVKANVTRASVGSSTDAYRLTDIGQIATRQLRLYDLFAKVPVGPASNGTVRYSDWTTATRAAAAVAEAGTFPESTAAWTEYTLTLQKIGDSIPVTEEMVRDQPRFAAELDQFIETNVNIKVDTDLLSGDGTSPNIKGIYTYAGTYSAAASGITAANQYDLIVKMVENITNGYNGKYRPNFVLMNMVDINKMRLKKDSTNNYIVPPFAYVSPTGDTINVSGLTVVECGALTANTMVVGDSRFAKIYEIDGYEASVGYINDQFTKDLMTMKAKKRLALLVRTADAGAFKKCTDIAANLVTLAS